ncbi:hypothetical protein COV93_00035 [Candidatus Woesearchaeota archaeon CG11_big_fil_rev_8_21_14_0_20_43_8]|nr:MAG: hypothetical protein COV93_00035 [Candidatus Woesearchaeota archaeon CG11_big_fil_rev_8_21_14_0_20_43_8]
MKKGQAAMEFLMSYGWAVLAGLVVIGGLAYFGVIKTDGQSQRICMFSYGMACQDFILKPDSASLYLTNSLGKDITVDMITLGKCNETFGTTLLNGDSARFTLNSCVFGTVGEQVSGKLEVVYTTGEGMLKYHRGDVRGKIE